MHLQTSPVKSTSRISGKLRREQILEAARGIFSEKGFDGTTTRELADAAAVSEALLFKHFPSKEAIYSAMLDVCLKGEVGNQYNRLLELEASTSTLIVMLHFWAEKVVFGEEEPRKIHRLLLRSLSEDGAFARILFKHAGKKFITKLAECQKTARRLGDIRAECSDAKTGGWLAHHTILMIGFIEAPAKAALDYKASREARVAEAVVFCLRGLGLAEKAIKKHYNPRALALLGSGRGK